MKKLISGIVIALVLLSALTACNKTSVPGNNTSGDAETNASESQKAAHFKLDQEPDMEKLKKLYPEFFDMEHPVAKGVEVYVWQMSEGTYSFGLMFGTNRSKTDEEIWALAEKPLTWNETKAVLNECGVSEDEIIIIPVIQPVSSYAYEIDDDYKEEISKLFEQTGV